MTHFSVRPCDEDLAESEFVMILRFVVASFSGGGNHSTFPDFGLFGLEFLLKAVVRSCDFYWIILFRFLENPY